MKKIAKNISIFSSYFIYEYAFIFILIGLNINYYNFSYKNKLISLSIINFVYLIFLLFMYKSELKDDKIDFKNNYKKYINDYLYIYFIGVILMGLSNILLQHITKLEMSGNESAIRNLIKTYPLYMIFSSVIYAPFTEEIIFRKSIKNIINNKYLFISISGIIFGILHISDFTNINEILMGIPYIIMGLDFAYIYQKSNNIFTTILFHLCHNSILIILQFL